MPDILSLTDLEELETGMKMWCICCNNYTQHYITGHIGHQPNWHCQECNEQYQELN